MNSGKESLRDCDFYIADKEDRSGMSFCMAYKEAKHSKNNMELCTSVASMICAVFPELRNHVDLALKGIGIKPREVKLPSEAEKFNIDVNEIPTMNWPTILVNLGCCILVLLKNNYENEENYMDFMSYSIRRMQEPAAYDPTIPDVDVPFDFERAKAIRSMLGGVTNPTFRVTIVKHMVVNINSNGCSQICGVCDSLFYSLYFSGKREFNVMNEMLVEPQSLVLNDPRVAKEVENLIQVCEVVKSHRDLIDPKACVHTQIRISMDSNAELVSVVDCLRFPTLFAVAQELNKKRGKRGKRVANSAVTSMAGVDLTIVEALVKLHRDSERRCRAIQNCSPAVKREI